ncbi:MAG: response regulator [Lachnospiraceae bacterium]|nr:response regulator [Lachnospiraceae bacterium]
MRSIFPQIMFACFVLALYFAIVVFGRKEMKYKENRLFTIFCLSSALWSFGFFGVIVQTDPDKAYAWRALGMIGTFAYLITAQLLVCHFSGIKKIFQNLFNGFSFLGIIIFFFVIQKDQVTYELTEIGMTYSFSQGLWNNLYIGYSIILALNMLIVIIHMLRHSKTQRLKELAKKILLTEMIIVFGMLFDTIFPLIGKMAIPGSTLAQFVGLVVMYNAIIFVSHSRITIGNMSEFIYYSLTVPVLVYDSNKQLQILNDTAFSFLGVDKDNMKSATIEQLFTLQQPDIFAFDGKSHEVDAICCHNQLYCSLSMNKIHDDYGDLIGYIIIVTDLSERMKSIQELEEAMKDAEHANQAKSIFLANMSHEIRTPMNAIIGFSELVLKMDIDQQVRKHVEDIKWSSHNLLAIINDILDISKIESGKMELVLGNYFTSTLLNDVALIIAPQAEKKGLAFHMKVDETIPKGLYGDKIRIRGILINILNNAVKYTQKGSVTFEANILSRDENRITLEFKIIDTGIGIRQENLENLFKNFERLDQKIHYGIEGSGLGLAIANGYVTLMGGEIQVSSTYGEGSVFTVILEQEITDPAPFEKEYEHKQRALTDTNTENMQIHGIKVLVVDDNHVNLRVAHGIMSSYGLLVDTASTGKEAIELCKNHNYPLVYMDQMMPEMDGIEAMKEIRSTNPYYASGGDGKIIVLTADAIKGTREHLIDLGFDEYLGKPINMRQLERLFVQFIPAENITYETSNKEASSPQTIQFSGQPFTQQTDISYLVDNLPQVQVEEGIANCGGTVTDYLNILKIAYKYGEKQLDELETAWKNKDYETYIIKIHSLKSTTLNIGAGEISKAARKQEEEGRAGNFSYIDEHREKFQEEYRKFLGKLEIVLEHYGLLASKKTDKTSSMLNDTLIVAILRNIDKCIDNFDFAKVFEILEKVKDYELPEKYKELLSHIETLMEDLSVDEIKELLLRELDQ